MPQEQPFVARRPRDVRRAERAGRVRGRATASPRRPAVDAAASQRDGDGVHEQPEFIDIRVTDPGGTVVAATDPGLLNYDFSVHPEFAHGCKHVHLGLPEAVQGHYEAFLVAPARTNEFEFLGVVAVRLKLERLQALLGDNQVLPSSAEVLLATRDGNRIRYLASPGSKPRASVVLQEAEPMRDALMGEYGYGNK